MKKIIILLMGVFLIFNASAFLSIKSDITLTKGENLTMGTEQIVYNDLWETYKPVEVKNFLGLGETNFKGAIVEHTGQCLIDCDTTIQTYLQNRGVLIKDFYLVDKNGTIVERPFSISYSKMENITLDRNDEKCTGTGKILKNGSEVQSCEIVTSKYQVQQEVSYPYKLGDEVNEGNYKVHINVKKNKEDNLDWKIVVVDNKVINEWAWYNTSWNYKIPFNLSLTTNPTITDMQVPINLTWNQSYKTDFSDLRFVNTTETGEYPIWVESFVSGVSARIWVRVNNNVTSTTQLFGYIYYNNSAATNISNPNTTFLLYDEFNEVNTTKWIAITGSESVSGGECLVDGDLLYTPIDSELGYVYEGRMKFAAGTDGGRIIMINSTTTPDPNDRIFLSQGGTSIQSYSAKAGAGGADTIIRKDAATTYFVFSGARANGTNIDYFWNGAANGTRTSGVPDVKLRFAINDYSTGSMTLDWVRVRGYNNSIITTALGTQSGQAVANTCTYTSGNWAMLCSDNCNITSNVALGGNNLSITGTGKVTFNNANVTGYNKIMINGTDSSNICEVVAINNGGFKD